MPTEIFVKLMWHDDWNPTRYMLQLQ